MVGMVLAWLDIDTCTMLYVVFQGDSHHWAEKEASVFSLRGNSSGRVVPIQYTLKVSNLARPSGIKRYTHGMDGKGVRLPGLGMCSSNQMKLIHWIQLHVKLIWSNEFDLICLRQWSWTWTKRHITASQSSTCHSTTSVDAVFCTLNMISMSLLYLLILMLSC